jgi:hypothetical protein
MEIHFIDRVQLKIIQRRGFDIDKETKHILDIVTILQSVETLNGLESFSHTIGASMMNIRRHFKNGKISVSLAKQLIDNLKGKIKRAHLTWQKK